MVEMNSRPISAEPKELSVGEIFLRGPLQQASFIIHNHHSIVISLCLTLPQPLNSHILIHPSFTYIQPSSFVTITIRFNLGSVTFVSINSIESKKTMNPVLVNYLTVLIFKKSLILIFFLFQAINKYK